MQRLAIAPSQFQNQQIILTAEQQHYLSRVLRLREGDRFIAMDGLGHWWLAKLEGNQAQILEPILQPNTELPVAITLMAALPKATVLMKWCATVPSWSSSNCAISKRSHSPKPQHRETRTLATTLL
jgi:RsmE family RNA methyltransferase